MEQPQSFTCPYCGKMGFTETSLQDHVTSEHAETSTEVVSVVPSRSGTGGRAPTLRRESGGGGGPAHMGATFPRCWTGSSAHGCLRLSS